MQDPDGGNEERSLQVLGGSARKSAFVRYIGYIGLQMEAESSHLGYACTFPHQCSCAHKARMLRPNAKNLSVTMVCPRGVAKGCEKAQS